MALTDSLPTGDAGGLTVTDERLILSGLVAKNTDGTPRIGVFPSGTAPLVTGRASMGYDVGPFKAATSRTGTGVELLANNAVTTVTTTAAPSANSRIDVIWVRPQFTANADAGNVPLFGVTQGAAQAVPTKPAIPTGALELATATILSTTTTTGTAVITQTAPFTTAAGGAVPFRTTTEMNAATTLADGTLGQIGSALWVIQGGKWGSVSPLVRTVAATASGVLAVADGYINLHPNQTIPSSPFGTGVPYDLIVDAYTAAGPGNGAAMRVRVDGAEAQTGAYTTAINTSGIDNYPRTHAVQEITTPDVAHTVQVQIIAQIGTVTIRSGQPLSGTIITLQRRNAF